MKNLTEKNNSMDSPEEFLHKEKTITDLEDIANSFNEYFSNTGPSLSEKIDMSGNDTTYNDYLKKFSPLTFFLFISFRKRKFKYY